MMKSFQAVILFILSGRSFSQNVTEHNETTTVKEEFQRDNGSTKWMKPTNTSVYRRGAPQSYSNINIFLKKQNKKLNFYEPYWEGGENVYLKTTLKQTSWKSKMFYNKTIPTTQTPWTTPYTGSEMGKNRDCNRDCPVLFSFDYGRVCGFRFNTRTWKNEFMEFENMCTLEQENCKFSDRRPMWVAIHRGICPELTTFKNFPTNPRDIKKRAKAWQEAIENSTIYIHRTTGIPATGRNPD